MRISSMFVSFVKSRQRQCAAVLALYLLYYFGVFAMMFQSNIAKFDYPLNEPIADYVQYWIDNKSPIREPINSYDFQFIHKAQDKCSVDSDTKLRIVYLVKSAVPHFDRRDAIRKSWGFERRFSDVEMRTLFVLGATTDVDLQKRVNEESAKNGDIVQATFIDNYYNNTIKTMMAITWAVKYCPSSKFYFFSDDDMYVSTKNVLRFVRNPLQYPRYLEEQMAVRRKNMKRKKQDLNETKMVRGLKQIVDIDLPDDAELYAGYVFRNSRPHRHQSSKWYLPLSEYPYNYFPPYVTAGAFVLTNPVLRKFYYGSFYTKHFRFDDIYLAILARKLNIVPVHSDSFYFEKKKPYDVFGYQYVVASHGYSDTAELQEVWHQQKSAGNA
uniref:Hexosyltransferase n=1 Tax=Lygus hesperus TaxID=30085 RepID=A0A146KWP0_LYGHE